MAYCRRTLMTSIRILLGVVLATLACRRAAPPAQSIKESPQGSHAIERLSTVDVSDGVDAQEAAVIAAVYFERYVTEFGWTDPPVRAGAFWHATPRAGLAGKPIARPIVIDARSGAVSLEGRTAFASLAALKGDLVDNLVRSAQIRARARHASPAGP
jgi:hypothetical protein